MSMRRATIADLKRGAVIHRRNVGRLGRIYEWDVTLTTYPHIRKPEGCTPDLAVLTTEGPVYLYDMGLVADGDKWSRNTVWIEDEGTV